MDWSTGDYTRTYADTIFVPEEDSDRGVYLLEEGGKDTDTANRAPIRPYGQPGRWGEAGRPRGAYTPYNVQRTREGFYGNLESSRKNNLAVFDNDWDERPMHYNPNAGTDWARLAPPPSLRPPGGGWGPNLAFQKTTPSEGLDHPGTVNRPSLASVCAGCAAGGRPGGGTPTGGAVGVPAVKEGFAASFQRIDYILFFLVVVLAAITCMLLGENRQLRKILAFALQTRPGASPVVLI